MSLLRAAGKGGSASLPSSGGQIHDFPRAFRLTSRRQFLTVYEQGRRISCPSFTLFGLPNSIDHRRMGVTVTRKIGGAVVRNRAKRLLREVFRHRGRTLHPPLDLVVNVRHGLFRGDLVQIERDLVQCFDRLVARSRP